MGDDLSISGSSASDDSYDSDSGSSDSDTYSAHAAAPPAAMRIPSLPGLGRLPTPGSSPSRGANAAGAARAQQRDGTPDAGSVSPSDVPLSALSLSSGSATANGVNGAPHLDLSAASGGDASIHSPASSKGRRSHRSDVGSRSHRSDGGSRTHRSGRLSARKAALSLDIVSPAFGLDKETLRRGEAAGAGPAEVARQRTAAGLGVPPAALRMFELREVAPGAELAEGSQRVAFAVSDSSFSLAAIEETMSENKRLMATNSHTSQALETLQELVKEQNGALAKLKVQAGEQAANARRLQERYDAAERFATMLRQQLERSENLRVQGQRALAELKMEFEALTSELMADGHVVEGTTGTVSPRLLTQAAAARQANLHALPAPHDGAASAFSLLDAETTARLAQLLERFSDESVLSRLEAVLEKASK